MAMKSSSASAREVVAMEIPARGPLAAVEEDESSARLGSEDRIQHLGEQRRRGTPFSQGNYHMLIVIGEIATDHQLQSAREHIERGEWENKIPVLTDSHNLNNFKHHDLSQIKRTERGICCKLDEASLKVVERGGRWQFPTEKRCRIGRIKAWISRIAPSNKYATLYRKKVALSCSILKHAWVINPFWRCYSYCSIAYGIFFSKLKQCIMSLKSLCHWRL